MKINVMVDEGIEDVLYLGLIWEEFKKVEDETFFTGPTTLPLELSTWSGEHFSFDADTLEEFDPGVKFAEAEISEELAKEWIRALDTWIVRDYENKWSDEAEQFSMTLLEPVLKMLGMEKEQAYVLLVRLNLQYEIDGIDMSMLQNAL